jgi:hypothetical protein
MNGSCGVFPPSVKKRFSAAEELADAILSSRFIRLIYAGEAPKEALPLASTAHNLLSPYSLWLWGLMASVALTEASVYILPPSPPFVYAYASPQHKQASQTVISISTVTKN